MKSSPSLRLSFEYDGDRREVYFRISDLPLRFRCDKLGRGYELVCLYCPWPLRVKQGAQHGPQSLRTKTHVTCSAHMWPLLDSCTYDKLEAYALDRLAPSQLTSDGFLSSATPRPFPFEAIEALAGEGWNPLELALVLELLEREVKAGTEAVWAAIHEQDEFKSWSTRRLRKLQTRHIDAALHAASRELDAALIQPS